MDFNLKNIFRKAIILEYNSRHYELKKGDIPGLKGDGRIVIFNMPGRQVQMSSGNFSNLDMSQTEEGSFINGVNIGELVTRLDTKK